MAHVTHDPRLVALPVDDREFVTRLLRELGPRAAAKRLNIGRATVLGIVATGECLRGTAALVREAKREKAA